MSSRKRRGESHVWNSYENYLAVHEKCMESLSHYFVESDSLSFVAIPPTNILLKGSMYCQGSLVLHVEKTLAVNDLRQVRGIRYRYQAQFSDPPTGEIFRYDNAHDGYHGHPDAFHKHVFSPLTWRAVFPPEHVGIENWPTLQEVLDELYQWWLDHRDNSRIYP